MKTENYHLIHWALCWGEVQAELLVKAGEYDKAADITIKLAKARIALDEELKGDLDDNLDDDGRRDLDKRSDSFYAEYYSENADDTKTNQRSF
jgi:hypothetical protein